MKNLVKVLKRAWRAAGVWDKCLEMLEQNLRGCQPVHPVGTEEPLKPSDHGGTMFLLSLRKTPLAALQRRAYKGGN